MMISAPQMFNFMEPLLQFVLLINEDIFHMHSVYRKFGYSPFLENKMERKLPQTNHGGYVNLTKDSFENCCGRQNINWPSFEVGKKIKY